MELYTENGLFFGHLEGAFLVVAIVKNLGGRLESLSPTFVT